MSLVVVASALLFRTRAVPVDEVLSHWPVVVNLLAGSLLGAWFGAGWATRLRSETLFKVIALLLVAQPQSGPQGAAWPALRRLSRPRESSLELYLRWLDAQWAAGQCNGAELWRRLKAQGFRGCLRVVAEWAARRRRAEPVDGNALSRAPSARTIARFMTIGRDSLSKSETFTVTAIESSVPKLVEAWSIIATFQSMIRKKSLVDLEPWLERARSSLVDAFARGVTKDQAAVSAAITSPWSNGQTEGQITKLKLVKRQMYGRGKIDLLQARVIGAT